MTTDFKECKTLTLIFGILRLWGTLTDESFEECDLTLISHPVDHIVVGVKKEQVVSLLCYCHEPFDGSPFPHC